MGIEVFSMKNKNLTRLKVVSFDPYVQTFFIIYTIVVKFSRTSKP